MASHCNAEKYLKIRNLANTLQKIADGGRDVFYKGDTAKTIDAFMKKNGGFLSYKDFADHIQPGSNLSLQLIVDITFGNFRRTGKVLPYYKC